jgi:phage terminase large subunit
LSGRTKLKVEIPEKLAGLFEPHRYKIIYGGRGSSKSWSVARALVATGAQRKLRVLCGREFQRSIKDSVHKLLCDQIDMMGLTPFYRTTQTTITGITGTEFIFEGLRFNASKLKSLEGIDVAWLEQAETVSQSSLDILLPTIRKENSEIWMTINPVLEDDPAYQNYVVNPPGGAWVVEQNWRDNPWFTGVLMDEMERLRARDPDLCAHIYDGQCLHALEGAIYANELRKAVAEDRIGAVPYIPGSPVHTAWDLGHSDNTAIWFFQRIGFQYHLIDFLQDNAQRIDFYLKALQTRGYLYGRHYLPHDAANGFLAGRSIEDQVSDVYGRASVVVVPRTDNVAADIDVCRTTFDLCHFDKEKCADGLHALRHYRYGVDENTGRRSRLPLHDWCLAGDTEVLTRNGKHPISELPETGEVLTQCGWSPYRNPRITRRNAPLVAVEFADGLTVRCTPEHMFLTDSGWKYASDLRTGSLILSGLSHLPSSLAVGCIESGHRQSISRVALARFTGMSGRLLSGRFPRAVTSTIETTIRRITTWITSNACQQRSIFATPGLSIRWGGESTLLTRQGSAPPNGTALMRAGNGIDVTRSGLRVGPNGSVLKLLAQAQAAVSYSWRYFEKAVQRRNTAPNNARWLTIATASALIERQDVWCLTVPGHESFALANGAIVHNSSDAADGFRSFCVGFRPDKRRNLAPERFVMEIGSGGDGNDRTSWLGV